MHCNRYQMRILAAVAVRLGAAQAVADNVHVVRLITKTCFPGPLRGKPPAATTNPALNLKRNCLKSTSCSTARLAIWKRSASEAVGMEILLVRMRSQIESLTE